LKRTNNLINAAIAVVFVGVLLYLGVYLLRSMNNGYVTAEAVYVDLQESGQAQGIIIREETVLFSSQPYVDILAEQGKNVAKGEVIANATDSAASMAEAARIHQLEMQIAKAQATSGTAVKADEDTAIRAALFDLSAAVARKEMSELYEPEVTLSSLLFRKQDSAVDAEQLAAMKTELNQLRNQISSNTTAITAPAAGLFTTAVDGYEGLTAAMLDELTPESLRALTERREDTEGYLGKIAVGTQWYFAALVNEKDAKRLSQSSATTLDLGKYASGNVEAVVSHISHPQNGVCAVVFKCRTALADTLSLRELNAEIVYGQVSGLRVPVRAVHVDENGQTFVYVMSSLQIEEKAVEILADAGDYYIVAAEPEVDALRVGNEIIVSGKNVKAGIRD
jgi:hypothetical protein